MELAASIIKDLLVESAVTALRRRDARNMRMDVDRRGILMAGIGNAGFMTLRKLDDVVGIETTESKYKEI